MKKSRSDRIQSLESKLTPRPIKDPVTFYSEEHGMMMQIVGHGLVVPAPMAIKEWEEMVSSANVCTNGQKPAPILEVDSKLSTGLMGIY